MSVLPETLERTMLIMWLVVIRTLCSIQKKIKKPESNTPSTLLIRTLEYGLLQRAFPANKLSPLGALHFET